MRGNRILFLAADDIGDIHAAITAFFENAITLVEDLPHRLEIGIIFVYRTDIINAVILDVEIRWTRNDQLNRAIFYFRHIPAIANDNQVLHG